MNELKPTDVNFEALEEELGGKLYRTFYDFFVNHSNDGTPFPDVGTIYCRDLLEYDKRGGNFIDLCSASLGLAFKSFVLTAF